MKKKSTNPGSLFKKPLVTILAIFSLLLSQATFAHSVDSYSGTCASGPQYKVTATISNVNSSSNYRWQWKNGASWVCFVNGANTINGSSYNVSGSVYNLTTTPGPIIFTNPNIGLQGLEIRMVISDGNGVNPCTLPAGNTWTSTTNHFINVANTSCGPCNAKVTSLYFNKLDNGADLSITNNATFNVAQLGSLYNLEAGTTGTVGSVKYTITGPTPTSNIENASPYNSPGTGNGAWTGAVGTYTVNLKTYSSADATGSLCHDTTITFNITTADCNCPGANIVLNPGFESGTTNWSSSAGTLTNGNGAVACGSFSGDLNNTSTSSKAWQTIGTDLAIGTVVNVSVYAGTHDNSFNNWVAVEFLNASNVVLGTSVYVQVDKVLANSPAGPQLYNFTATVPTGTKYTRVAFGGTGSYTKTDRWCTYTTPPAPTGSIGDRVWLDADGDGIQDAAETGGITGVTVQLRNSANNVISTQNTNASGNYLFTGLAAGTYTVVFPVSISGAVVTTANVGANDDIDSDPSQATGITGNIVLAANQNITNVDAGYCPVNLQLGNRVWYDTNNNGINDAGENGIRNVTVRLYKDDNNDNIADGAALATLLTDVNGNYTFSNLAPGNYIVGAVAPNGYTSSSVNGGDPDNNTDLDDNGQVVSAGNEMRGLSITLTGGGEPAGNTNNTYDFGFLPDCACTNSASNLLVNASFENGTTGWFWSGGTLTTGPGYVACGTKNGFNDWSSGTSKVWQDVTIGAGSIVSFSAFAGTHAPGIACSPKLSLIFFDAANTAIGQTDVTVTRVVGDYNDQLEQYSITAVAPAGTVKARVQSSITCNTMKLDAFCLTAIVPANLNLGNFVWYDANNNGVQDATEPGINGATVKLYVDANSDNVPDGAAIATTTTNPSGAYGFGSLTAGNYIAAVTLPAGYTGTAITATSTSPNNDNNTDNNGVTIVNGELRSNFITLSAGGEPTTDGDGNNGNLTLDFGLKGTASLGDFVWQDLNRNGLQDANETGIAGATVTLTTPSGNITTTTNASGAYSFTNLLAGTYSLTFTTPAGFAFTALPNVGANDAIDSDPVAGVVSNITLAAGEVNNTIDAGFYKVISLSGNVWHDVNGMTDNLVNNTGPLQTPPAIVIPTGLRVSLVDAVTNQVIGVALVQGNGMFNFPNVTPGFYVVLLSQLPGTPGQLAPFATVPSGWVNTGENLGLQPGRDPVINGKLSVSVTTVNVTNANFGIQLNNDDTGIN